MADGKVPTVEVLDHFRLEWDGTTIDVPPHSATLVAHLAITGGLVHRSAIAGTLAPALSERNALAALRSALYRIGVPVVRSNGDLLCLAPEVQVDLRDAIRLARDLVRSDQPPARIESTVELLGRELLPDEDSPWIEPERQRFRHLRVSALDRLATCLSVRHRHAEAVEVAQLAAAIEPVSETAEATLIRALVAEGNEALAVREYQSFRRRLWRELRIRPTKGFEALRDGGSGPSVVTSPRRSGDDSATWR